MIEWSWLDEKYMRGYRNNWHVLTCLLNSIITLNSDCLAWLLDTRSGLHIILFVFVHPVLKGDTDHLLCFPPGGVQTLCSLGSDSPGEFHCRHLLSLPALMGLGLPSEVGWSQASASGCMGLIPHQLSGPASMRCIGIGARTCHWIKQESIVKLYFLMCLISFGLGEKSPLFLENLIRSWKLVLSPGLLMILISSLFWQWLDGSKRLLKLRSNIK